MKRRGNARTCPKSRELLVARIECKTWSLAAAAAAAGVSERTAYRWLKRWREEGEARLADARARRTRPRTAGPPDRVHAIEALRRLRVTAAGKGSPRAAIQIAPLS